MWSVLRRKSLYGSILSIGGGLALYSELQYGNILCRGESPKISDRNVITISLEDSIVTSFSPMEISKYNRKEDIKVTMIGKHCGRINTNSYKGPLLLDVLEHFHIGPKSNFIKRSGIRYAEFESNTENGKYSVSIPIEKAFNIFGDVILAYEMDNKPLDNHHGGPVRAVVPGYVSNASVKNLTAIHLRREPGKSIGHEYACMCDVEPQPSNEIDSDDGMLSGWASSGGGRAIIRVELSFDNGKSWKIATVKRSEKDCFNRHWSAATWTYSMTPEENAKSSKYLVRAIDTSINQSEIVEISR